MRALSAGTRTCLRARMVCRIASAGASTSSSSGAASMPPPPSMARLAPAPLLHAHAAAPPSRRHQPDCPYQQQQQRAVACAAASKSSSSSSSSGGSDTTTSSSSGGSSSGGSGGGASASSGGSGPINKAAISTKMDARLYDYLLRHTREPPILRALREETAGLQGANMQVSPEQGAFMALLAELTGAKRALEVGVYTGYSSLAVALAMPPDGALVACDRDERSMAVARRYWREAGVDHKIDARLAPAEETLQRLLDAEGAAGTFDFAFIDADKRAYGRYFELCLRLVRRGGLIAVDNVLWYGKVADDEVQDKATVALREFNAALLRDARVTASIVPVGDGMALCRVR